MLNDIMSIDNLADLIRDIINYIKKRRIVTGNNNPLLKKSVTF